MKQLRDVLGGNGTRIVAPQASDTPYSGALVADAAQSVVVPADATIVLFSSEVSYWVEYTKAGDLVTLTGVPTGAIAPGAAVLNPISLSVRAGDTLTIVSSSAGLISMAFYSN